MSLFPSIHSDDLEGVVGYVRRKDIPTDPAIRDIFLKEAQWSPNVSGDVLGIPVRRWCPQKTEEREDLYRRQEIQRSQELRGINTEAVPTGREDEL